MEVSETTIWRNFRFVRFFISFTIGNIGDWFDIFALQIIFVHEWQASPMLMGVLILFYFLPTIVLSPIAGVWADRVSQRNLMLVTDSLASILTLGLYFSPNVLSALILLLYVFRPLPLTD
ncbi:MAG: MFS transporter [Gammaproteobacteria bacterium]|nr:MFS transporter [Gammaproteobacteria bacterium]